MFQQISRKNRKISQEQTRGRLIDAGREHFLRFGLAGATSERIAAAAGFTRGALYANFDNLDDLFVAVMSANSDRDLLMFRTIFEKAAPALERFARIREAYAGLVTEAPWVLLQAEFQANALRRSAMRAAYVEQQARRAAQGAAMIREMAEELDLRLAGTPEEIVGGLGSLIEGLAIRHGLLEEPSADRMKELALACFDRLLALPALPGT